jgi:hypothetical protein
MKIEIMPEMIAAGGRAQPLPTAPMLNQIAPHPALCRLQSAASMSKGRCVP